MIAYGFIVDLDKLKGKKRDQFCDFIENETHLTLMTGYSVGSFEPGMAVVGVKVDGTNFLFGPTLLSKLDMAPSSVDKFLVDEFDLKTVNEWIECFENTEPGLIVYDDTDD
jgi:hypothetical protein